MGVDQYAYRQHNSQAMHGSRIGRGHSRSFGTVPKPHERCDGFPQFSPGAAHWKLEACLEGEQAGERSGGN